MKIAILSGKGGTGKTFVATNLAAVTPSAAYADCDVEEPNGHIFLQPANLAEEEILVPVPVVDGEKCTACRTCIDFCRYNALALIANEVKIFEDICHNCGGCALFCPEKAITEKGRTIGILNTGRFDGGSFYSGRLNPGEASGVPIIEAVLRKMDEASHDNVIIDCPPGSACVVMESIKNADFCVLVAEPTVFGAHNLHMVYELVSIFNKPHAVLLNKDVPGENNPSARFCEEHAVTVLGSIPYSEEVARINAKGLLAVRESPAARLWFTDIAQNIATALKKAGLANGTHTYMSGNKTGTTPKTTDAKYSTAATTPCSPRGTSHNPASGLSKGNFPASPCETPDMGGQSGHSRQGRQDNQGLGQAIANGMDPIAAPQCKTSLETHPPIQQEDLQENRQAKEQTTGQTTGQANGGRHS